MSLYLLQGEETENEDEQEKLEDKVRTEGHSVKEPRSGPTGKCQQNKK